MVHLLGQSPTRVLHVSHQVELGAAERSLLSLLSGFDCSRHVPHLACDGDGPLPDAARKLGVVVHDVPLRFKGIVARSVGLLRSSRALSRLIQRHDIDLIHSNTLADGYAAALAALRAGIPNIWHVRDLGYPLLGRMAADASSWRIASSAATAKQLAPDQTTVIHDGVDRAFFEQRGTRRAVQTELGIPFHHNLVAMVGDITAASGHDVLLDAAAQAGDSHTTWLVIGDEAAAGAGPRLTDLQRRAQDLGLGERVRFLGHRGDLAWLLAACDVLVHPSVNSEAAGHAVAAAQAAGVPVIASDVSGLLELIDHGTDGWLVHPGDPGQVAERVTQLMRDPGNRHRMGRAARAKAEVRWSPKAHAAATQSLYERMLEPTPTAQPAAEQRQVQLRVLTDR